LRRDLGLILVGLIGAAPTPAGLSHRAYTIGGAAQFDPLARSARIFIAGLLDDIRASPPCLRFACLGLGRCPPHAASWAGIADAASG